MFTMLVDRLDFLMYFLLQDLKDATKLQDHVGVSLKIIEKIVAENEIFRHSIILQ